MKKLLGVFSKAIVLGTVAVAIFALLKIITLIVFKNLHELWFDFFIHFGTTGTVAKTLEYTEAVLYTTVLATIVGLVLLAKGRGDQNIGDKTLGKVPLLRTIWSLFHNTSELIHHITERPFVLVLDWPGEGHEVLGVITGKKTFSENGVEIYSKPTVYIFTPPNPTSGFLTFPERDKIILLIPTANQVMKVILSIGMLGPRCIEFAPDQSPLDYYYKQKNERCL